MIKSIEAFICLGPLKLRYALRLHGLIQHDYLALLYFGGQSNLSSSLIHIALPHFHLCYGHPPPKEIADSLYVSAI